MFKKLTEPIIAESEATPEQVQEIETGEWVTVKQMANKLSYSTAYVSALCKRGQIKGVKPLGGQWRIPRSEYDRVVKEGSTPMYRQPKEVPKPVIELPSNIITPVTLERPTETNPEPSNKPERWGPWDILFKNNKEKSS